MYLVITTKKEKYMYARVNKTGFQPGKKDAAKRIYHEFVKTGKEQEGFLGAMLLTSEDGEKVISVTYWKDKDDMVRTEESGWWQAQIDRFKEVFSGPPVREHYEVAYHSFPKEEAKHGAEHQESRAEQPGEAGH
jgi:heme-degrading monooxygenase HmoA